METGDVKKDTYQVGVSERVSELSHICNDTNHL